jgi:hypothetical protein
MQFYFNSDINNIQTPADEDYNLPGYGLYESGYGLGLAFRHAWNDKLSYRVGVQYDKKSYLPRDILERYAGGAWSGYYIIHVDQVNFHTLTIPAELLFSLSSGRALHIYTITGLSSSFSLSNDYRIEQNYEGTSDATPATPPTAEESILLRKSFDPGIAKGGDVGKNTYVAFHGGLGLRYALQRNSAIVWEVQYRPTLIASGLGPFKDRINTFSMKFGYEWGF